MQKTKSNIAVAIKSKMSKDQQKLFPSRDIEIAALCADQFIDGEDDEELVVEQVTANIINSQLSDVIIDIAVTKITMMETKSFIKYIKACVNDETVKDYDSFIKWYVKESPTLAKNKV